MVKLVFKILFFVFITSFAYANDEKIYEDTKLNFNSHKPVACSHPDTIIGIVDKTFLEKPYMQGKGIAAAVDGQQFIKTNIVIAVNLETKTFSIVEFIAPNLVCIIGGGNEFEFLTPETEKTNIILEK